MNVVSMDLKPSGRLREWPLGSLCRAKGSHMATEAAELAFAV